MTEQKIDEAEALRGLRANPPAASPPPPPQSATLGWLHLFDLFFSTSPRKGCASCCWLGCVGYAVLLTPFIPISNMVKFGPSPSMVGLTLAVVLAVVGTVVGLRFVRAREERSLRDGVFVPAIVVAWKEEAISGDGEDWIDEHADYVYEHDGTVHRATVWEQRDPGTPPRLHVSDRFWVFVRPSDPGSPLREGELRRIIAVTPSRPAVAADPHVDPQVGLVPRAVKHVAVEVQPAQVCPFCRGELGADLAVLTTCNACGTVLHKSCLIESGGCTSLGCRNNPRR